VVNLSGADVSGWEASLELDGATTITNDWSFIVETDLSAGNDVADVVPEPYAEDIDHARGVWGGFCMFPARNILGVEVDH
jgi:hypothetical protein